MLQVDDQKFQAIVADGIDAIPKKYQARMDNVAFIVEDEPSPEQRIRLNLQPNSLLFGLYEGVALPRRHGATNFPPDKITLFKQPLLLVSHNEKELRENVRHTIWHEVAHYFGLDHDQIRELE